MRHVNVLGLIVATTLGLAACDPGAQGSSDTAATTQNLLTQTATTSLPGGLEQQGPSIDVSLLGFNRGPEDALVRVVELSDYGCGYCRQFHMETFPTLLTDFMESGKVQWKFMPFITGMFENSLSATEGAECALEQSSDLFLVLNERLWTDQADWKKSDNPDAVVRTMATEAGVDMAAWDGCVAQDRRHDRIASATALAQQLGVRGTPTFFVVGYPPLQGALPTDAFQEILNTVYAEATGGGN
ncbi:MAG: thioredoxin domain-containing protein [Gemmatimonadetes bacterium]|jgi:protein-disulfide isomerase|nr:thioredoxin domain-containing protein [Gemmatimonadota bacterium]